MKLRNVIFWCHLVIGVTVGVVILIMAVTGTMLAFRPQILDFAERDVRKVAVPFDGAQRLSLELLTAKAYEMMGEDDELTVVSLKSDPISSVVVNFGRKAVYVNPYTGQVLGQGSKVYGFLEKVEVWHRWLGMEGKFKSFGHNIKGICNIAFFVMIVSGFYLWWPKEWAWPGIKNIIAFNLRAIGKARDWNWHNVIGFWCAPFLIVISLTGLIMSYQWANNLLFRLTGNEPPAPSVKMAEGGKNDSGAVENDVNPASLDKLFVQAQKQEPNWRSMNIRLPQKPGGAVTIMIQEMSSPYPSPRSTLTLDAVTAEVKKWEPISEQNLGRKLRLAARYLHTGELAGVGGQMIAFLAAAGATMLVWTGMAMAWRRFFVKT